VKVYSRFPLAGCPKLISGAFAKLRKATLNFFMSVSPHTKNCSHWTDFDETSYLGLFKKSIQKIQISLKSDKNNW
jgi:hypothetical protein